MRYLPSRAVSPGNLSILPLLALTVAWFVLLRPSFIGGPASYVMVSGESMEPTLSSGDLVVTQKEDAYRVGDLVAFRVPKGEHGEGALVIHRIVRGTAADGFTTQGDNNDWLDPWSVKAADIVGKKWVSVPGAGRWLDVLRTPMLLAGLAGSLVVSLILMEESGRWSPRRRREAGRELEPVAESVVLPTPDAPVVPARRGGPGQVPDTHPRQVGGSRGRAIPWAPLLAALWLLLAALALRSAGSMEARR
jgi:signal peptidase I